MKKLLALFLSLAMVLSIVGCGKKDNAETNDNSVQATETSQSEIGKSSSDKGSSTQSDSSETQEAEDTSALKDISLTLTSYTESVELFDTPDFTMTLTECFTDNYVYDDGYEDHNVEIMVDFENKTDRAIMITDDRKPIINGETVKSIGFLGSEPGSHDVDSILTVQYEEEAPLVIDLEADFTITFCELIDKGEGRTSWDQTDEIGTFHLSLHYDVSLSEKADTQYNDTEDFENTYDDADTFAASYYPENLITDLDAPSLATVIIDHYEFDLTNINNVQAFPVYYENNDGWDYEFTIDSIDFANVEGLSVGADPEEGLYIINVMSPCDTFVSIRGLALDGYIDEDILMYLMFSGAEHQYLDNGLEVYSYNINKDEYSLVYEILVDQDIIVEMAMIVQLF